jgi:hypothetical protein
MALTADERAAAMITPGHFVLHSRALPPLPAGDYVLRGDQALAAGSISPYEGHVRVSSPRFTMSPDHILSTWPPANSEGAYDARLPQIVLRRRTLPWERALDPADRDVPWLALIVIAEGEGQLSGEVPVAQCVTPGITMSGPNDVATGVYLAVPQSVVDKVFPTAEDLPLLTHVREVDIDDTELAMGDDDGFLAVVLANRLPQFDQANCLPVRYLACLVNLEGQLDALPAPADVSDDFEFGVVIDLAEIAGGMAIDTDHFVMGTGEPASAGTGAGASPGGAGPTGFMSATSESTAAASWAVGPERVEEVAVSAAPEEAARLVRDAMASGFRYPLETLVEEPVYRFPVLVHWSFTSTGAGSFETLMQGLDVGLLGTTAADPAARPRPDCAEPQGGDAPPAAPAPRPAPELAETGHVGLPHQTRRGESVRAWYRSPLSPHVTERAAPDEHGRLVLAHTSDQLRRIVPDGREDLTLAAAFEIGRLLALSQPSVVAALMRWRREQFGAERARRLVVAAAEDVSVLTPALAAAASVQLGQLLGLQLVLAAAEAPEEVLAPSRPLADPGRPVTAVAGDLDTVLADGFGLPLERVRAALHTRTPVDALNVVDVATGAGDGDVGLDETASAGLHDALTHAVDTLATDVIKPPPKPGGRKKRDPLDRLLDESAELTRREVDG